MGEMADMLMYDDPFDNPYDPEPSPGVICKYCKCGPLKWGQRDQKWRLLEQDYSLHNCPVNPLKERE